MFQAISCNPIVEQTSSQSPWGPRNLYEVRTRILNRIYSHEFDTRDLTEEASLFGIADETDVTNGRGRMAFDSGNVNIHTVSALNIERVEITQGKEVPIQISIHMNRIQ